MMDIEEIISTYYRKIFKLCLFYLNNDRQEAEEMVQEIFYKIMKKLKTFKGQSSIYTWIYRLAVNSLLNYIKRKKIVEFISFDNLRNNAETAGDDLSTAAIDPAQKLEDDQLKRNRLNALKKGIHHLSEREKTAFYFFYYDNLKQKEIADIMNTSVPAVESLVHKAKKKLQYYTGTTPANSSNSHS